ncbi:MULTISPECIES: M48 family metalloprotease [Giesbergeria]|uniref:M48 family metalloprotease n=1 Tax=Giesbergeria sinuosa TaxID=80883 RepID=A0ABV9QAG8_9BURK
MKFWNHQENARTETRRLLLAFAVAVLLLVAGVHGALVLAWWLLNALLPVHWPYPAGFMAVNMGMTLFFILGGWWLETANLRAGGVKLALRVGAREARPGSSYAEQRLCNVVQELCIAAHMPVPQVMVLARTPAINAFAAGWDQSDAVVAVTQGALDYLNREELQGMVAHELSHLHEGDTRLKMRLAGMVFGLELVHHFGDTLRERGGLAPLFGSAIMAVGWLGWLVGQALQAAVSRQREYLADARAVQWTRSQQGLGGVLRKVLAQRQAAQANRHGRTGLEHPSVQPMLLVDVAGGGVWARWLDSHPPLLERVQRIYGRPMPPLPLVRVEMPPDPQPPKPVLQPGPDSLAAQVDPFARYL